MIADLDDLVVPPGQHVVQFYDRDEALVLAVCSFLGAGLAAGEAAVVVGTAAHRRSIEAVLVAAGVHVADLADAGRYRSLDARELLATFVVDGRPDPVLFDASVGGLLRALEAPVRVFGEMVAMQWADDDVAGALVLEQLWNDLAARSSFTLFCGYPKRALTGPAGAAICHHHTLVVPEPRWPESGPDEAARRFEPTPFAVPMARRFVTDTLRAWGRTSTLDTVELVLTEMVGNAVRHGGRRFRVSVRALTGHLRLAVTDASPLQPRVRPDDPQAIGGRGMHIIDKLSYRWGCDPHGTGKTVWADISDPRADPREG